MSTLSNAQDVLQDHERDLGAGPQHDTDASVKSFEESQDDIEQDGIIMEADDDDDSVEWGIPKEDDLDNDNPANKSLLQFRECCKKALEGFTPFSAEERRLVSLIYVGNSRIQLVKDCML